MWFYFHDYIVCFKLFYQSNLRLNLNCYEHREDRVTILIRSMVWHLKNCSSIELCRSYSWDLVGIFTTWVAENDHWSLIIVFSSLSCLLILEENCMLYRNEVLVQDPSQWVITSQGRFWIITSLGRLWIITSLGRLWIITSLTQCRKRGSYKSVISFKMG